MLVGGLPDDCLDWGRVANVVSAKREEWQRLEKWFGLSRDHLPEAGQWLPHDEDLMEERDWDLLRGALEETFGQLGGCWELAAYGVKACDSDDVWCDSECCYYEMHEDRVATDYQSSFRCWDKVFCDKCLFSGGGENQYFLTHDMAERWCEAFYDWLLTVAVAAAARE